MTARPPLERLLDVLEAAGQESTAEEVAEMLWLAARLPSQRAATPKRQPVAPARPPPARRHAHARESLPPSRAETFGPNVTATTEPATGPATTDLYPSQADTGAGGTAARRIRSPGAAALPGSLEIGRSLRPLKRRVPSRAQVVLDEDATAHRIADTGDWTPVFRPAPERWLELALVVEDSPSMVIWQRTLVELQRLLERQGAFRRIEVYGFRAAAGDRDIELYSGIGPNAARARRHRPGELSDPLGRRLIAVVSDCVSPVWHNGVMATLLSGWGETGLAAIAQVLPDRLWVRTGLRTYPAIFMRSPAPGAPNSTYEVEWTSYRPTEGAAGGSAVPVVSLEAQSLGHWARAVAGNSNLWIPGVFAIPTASSGDAAGSAAAAPERPTSAVPPEQLVQRFYGTASPTARHLASLLAAVPLTLPVMRLVQRALLPDSRQVHLAEVWLSGLVDRPSEVDRSVPVDDVEYLFVNGVRDLLHVNLRLYEVLDVLSAVSGYVGEHAGQPLDFEALVADPQLSGEVHIKEGYQSFARVAAGTLRRFGGQYADLARRLEVGVYGAAMPAVERPTEVRVERPGRPSAGQAGRAKRTVRVRALLVGANEIAAPNVPPLQGGGNDVRRARNWLRDRGVAARDITTLVDRKATKPAIVDAWRAFASQVEEGDQLYFQFSGRDQAIASDDPNEADGLEETLVVYDSVPGERATLLTHRELADLAAEVERRGGTAILILDSCRTASGFLARQALRNTLVIAGAAEAEEAYETYLDGKHHGAVSHALAEAMRTYEPGMTWDDAFDQVLARVRAMGFQQTPQLIGDGSQLIFGSERRTVLPHLLVTKVDAREIEVHAPAALGLGTGERGARLEIYPPGSAMAERPLGVARVRHLTDGGVGATVESRVTVPVAARVRVLEYGDERPVVTVDVSGLRRDWVGASSLVGYPLAGDAADLTVSPEDGALVLYDSDRHELWREPLIPPDGSPEPPDRRVQGIVEHLALYFRSLERENADIRSELAGRVELELAMPAPDDGVRLAEGEPLRLRLRNRAASDLYVSVWMFDEHLGVERIFPATTSCVLLGKGREVALAVAVQPTDARDRASLMTFRAFASTDPADLGMISLPRLDRPFDLSGLVRISLGPMKVEFAPRRVPNEPPPERVPPEGIPWVTGGPVAVTAKLWTPGTTLRVKFLSGTPALQQRVMQVASEWIENTGLRFDVVVQGDADLRVDFQPGMGSWSALGTDALSTPQDQPTINLGKLEPSTDDVELRRTVLHEFGHALGLAAAQQSPIAAIPWNRSATYEYFARPPNKWSKADVDRNVFEQYDRGQVTFGPADPNSIMYHPIQKEWTDGKVEIVQADKLSGGDKRFIAQLYAATTHRDIAVDTGGETRPHGDWTSVRLPVLVRFIVPTREIDLDPAPAPGRRPLTKPTPTASVEPELIMVPAGPFKYGRAGAHVDLGAFWIGRFPVTNREYVTYVEDAGLQPPRHWGSSRPPAAILDHPVVWLSRGRALRYCTWLARRTGTPYRLPTEQEWEKAARGPDGNRYPWGNAYDEMMVLPIIRSTVPVGSFSPGSDSVYGVADMVNLRYWTASSNDKAGTVVVRGRADANDGVNRATAFLAWTRREVTPVPKATIGFRVAVSRVETPEDDGGREQR